MWEYQINCCCCCCCSIGHQKENGFSLVANSYNLCKTARGKVGGSDREYSFSRQICIVSSTASSGTFVNTVKPVYNGHLAIPKGDRYIQV